MAGFTIHPEGAYSLRESVEFGFGQRHSEKFEGEMVLAFCLDGYDEQVGVVLRQDETGTVHGTISETSPDGADPARVERQVARILSLDHDARPYEEIAERDPVIARLQARRPGLRPPLFHSPYEAACWAVLSHRRPSRAATDLRDRLSHEHGRVIEVAGRELAAFPTPDQLLAVTEVPGLPADRVPRLHAMAERARDGGLDADRLRAIGPEEATRWVQQLPGIGPFYASLIVVRATGFCDVLVDSEPRLLALVEQLYDLAGPPDAARLAEIAEAWRPRRTWAAVLVRAAGAAAA